MEVSGMEITTFIELENKEVEQIANAKMLFSNEHVNEQIIETCVEGFQIETGEKITSEEAIQRVFDHLKVEGVIPQKIEDFSFEMPSCERLKKSFNEKEVPQKVVISYVS